MVPQSTEGFHEHYVKQVNEQGQSVFQLAGGGHRHETNNTDTTSLADGFITVTALSVGMTNHRRMTALQQVKW